MENHPSLWRRIRRVRRIQVCMARKGIIRGKLIPLLTGRAAPGDNVREPLALHPRLGGIGLINPAIALQNELERSMQTGALLQIRSGTKSHALGTFVIWLLAIAPQLLPCGNKSLLMLPQPCKLPCQHHSNGRRTSFLTKVLRTGSPFSLPKSAFHDALPQIFRSVWDMFEHCSFQLLTSLSS